MIVSVSLENWMSFRERVDFSMIASRERQHGERVPKIKKYPTRILPIAALYGGNASGKTNFFKALGFARNLIVDGTKPGSLIPIEPYRLDEELAERPSRFQFELLIENKIFEYSFALNQEAVVEEKLVIVTSTSEKVLYHRQNKEIRFNDRSLDSDPFLKFVFRGTRRNQLFLTNSISQQVDTFQPIYDWFKDSLQLIAPDSRFAAFERFLGEADPLHSTMSRMLAILDTGIDSLGSEEVSFDKTPFPASLQSKLLEDVKEGETVRLLGERTNERFVVARKDGELIAKKPVTYHLKEDGSKAKFELHKESDGSQRLVDLLPAFLDLYSGNSNSVYVIDEIDRSLHSLLIRKLLKQYLANCTTETRTQLLFTTHDILLLDQQLLRRDEMWAVERDIAGNSKMFSFSEYKDVRYDKDIRKSYLQGRLGGIPRIPLGDAMIIPSADGEQLVE